ncbi:MAG: DnaJ C-terminal domain-containing protein [Desulfobaccales bacterium]
MTLRESYRILGVTSTSTWEEVRRRFRLLVQKCHPDRNPDDPQAAARFRRLVEAYEVVRADLDQPRRSGKRYYRNPASAKRDFFEEILGVRPEEEPLGQFAGPDFRYDLRIPFVDAALGLDTTISIPRLTRCGHCDGGGRVPAVQPQTCPACYGQGRPIKGPGMFRSGPVCRRCHGRGVIYERPCPVCEGRGYLQEARRYHLNIPPGTEDGARFRFEGEGGESYPGGPPGNLEVVISVEPHEFFTRKGRDLHCKFKVSFAQAALGGEVRVPTLRGYATLKLPRGTQNGWVFRFPAAGMPGDAQASPGDQIVEVVVTTPEQLSLTQREIMEELARLEKSALTRAAHE